MSPFLDTKLMSAEPAIPSPASRIVQIMVKEGDKVDAGTPLVMVEAMKTVRESSNFCPFCLTLVSLFRSTFSVHPRMALSAE